MPRDWREATPEELRKWLPEPYWKLPPDLLHSLIAGLPGYPGPIWAGGVKSAFLYTASDTFYVSTDWNPADNLSHAIGMGGKGGTSVVISGIDGTGAGGGGGAGAAYANKLNLPGIFGDQFQIIVGTSPGASSSINATDLLAVGGGNGNGPSGGTSPGGTGGDKLSCIGDVRSSGADGQSVSGVGTNQPGGAGSGAGGPHGDGSGGVGDVGDLDYGGSDWKGNGNADWDNANPFKPWSGKGWNYNVYGLPNAGSGGGGNGGIAIGNDGGLYGGGSGGGGWDGTTHTGGTPGSGCILIVNNASL